MGTEGVPSLDTHASFHVSAYGLCLVWNFPSIPAFGCRGFHTRVLIILCEVDTGDPSAHFVFRERSTRACDCVLPCGRGPRGGHADIFSVHPVCQSLLRGQPFSLLTPSPVDQAGLPVN